MLIDKLPGTPDGVSRAHDGSFWVSLIADVPGFTKWFGLPVVRGVLGHIPGRRVCAHTQQQQLQCHSRKDAVRIPLASSVLQLGQQECSAAPCCN